MEQNKDQGGAAVRGEAVAEFNLLHRGGHSPSTSGNGIEKSWMDELDQSREYIRGHGEKSSTSGASAAANELVDSSKPPVGLDEREQLIWMMGRNSKESGAVLARAADAPSEPSENEQVVKLKEQNRSDFMRWERMANIYRYRAEKAEAELAESRAADALDSQPGTDEPTDRETLIACLGDDAVTLLRANPGDEMAQTMREAAAMLESDGKALDSQPTEPWTRTEDRLPPVKTPVLILHSDDVKIGEIRWERPSWEEGFEPFMYWDDPNDDGQSWDWLEVTHWMPIPPAPASSQPTDGVGADHAA